MEQLQPSVNDHREIRLDVPCGPEWAALLRLAVSGVAIYYDFSTVLIDDLKLAVTEAYQHAIAGARDATRVQLSFDVSPVAITIIVDADAPQAVPSVEDAEVSLFVLRALMDDVTIGGTDRYRLTLTKALP